MIGNIFHLAFIPPTILMILIIIPIIYNAWYKKHYITKDSCNKYAKGWHKCWKCKVSESKMYYTETLHGRIYMCLKCSKNQKSKT
jgi:hypothetical protein